MINERVMVLDKGWIELQDVMGDDNAIVSAARASFLGESKGTEKDKRLLFYLLKHYHTTPFEMVEFKFRIRAPVVVWWQWVRHRTWSFNAQSGRYTPFKEKDFFEVGSEQWRLQSEDNKQASEGYLADGQWLSDALVKHYEEGYRLYEAALQAGVAREQARLFLAGFAVYYTWVCKTDAHNLMRFLRLRMATDAQLEIREYAQTIFREFFKPALPWTAEAFEKYRLQPFGIQVASHS
ncbi:MAG: FAD-dependent thymidylate synthase [Chloroflexota bacterium]|nr:FAD-dependent thymidylate synthase [Chloroflexota bacterium]